MHAIYLLEYNSYLTHFRKCAPSTSMLKEKTKTVECRKYHHKAESMANFMQIKQYKCNEASQLIDSTMREAIYGSDPWVPPMVVMPLVIAFLLPSHLVTVINIVLPVTPPTLCWTSVTTLEALGATAQCRAVRGRASPAMMAWQLFFRRACPAFVLWAVPTLPECSRSSFRLLICAIPSIFGCGPHAECQWYLRVQITVCSSGLSPISP